MVKSTTLYTVALLAAGAVAIPMAHDQDSSSLGLDVGINFDSDNKDSDKTSGNSYGRISSGLSWSHSSHSLTKTDSHSSHSHTRSHHTGSHTHSYSHHAFSRPTSTPTFLGTLPDSVFPSGHSISFSKPSPTDMFSTSFTTENVQLATESGDAGYVSVGGDATITAAAGM